MIRHFLCAYQGVRNFSFSENFRKKKWIKLLNSGLNTPILLVSFVLNGIRIFVAYIRETLRCVFFQFKKLSLVCLLVKYSEVMIEDFWDFIRNHWIKYSLTRILLYGRRRFSEKPYPRIFSTVNILFIMKVFNWYETDSHCLYSIVTLVSQSQVIDSC